MLVVTGATGKLGRQIVEELLVRIAPERIGASVRDPDKARDLAARGVRVRQGDFESSESLSHAFEDVEQLLLVSSNAGAEGGDPLAQHRTAIDAAKSAGARRIVYTSHMGASATSAFPPMHTHAATEEVLRDAGIGWTALRNGFYAETVRMLIGDAVATGVLSAPLDGRVSWTDHADLAAAAASILIRDSDSDGPTPPLTSLDAPDLKDVASILSDLHGKAIERRIIADEEQTTGMARDGVPASVIHMTMALYRAARRDEFAATDRTLSRLIGRRPRSLCEVLEEIGRGRATTP